MATISSVLGPLDTRDLGFTLMHEHCQASAAGIPQNYPEFLGRNYIDHIAGQLKRAKSDGGVNTIVDATTLDLGRDAALMAEVSRRSGVNIIATTGWWGAMPHFLANVPVDKWAEVFIREIKEGIAGTGIKAGLLKAAHDITGVAPSVLTVTDWSYQHQGDTILRAVARAHLQTRVPITLHSFPVSRVAYQQLAILKEEGVNLNRVQISHSNDTTDVEYLISLLEQGCYLGMDRYPGTMTHVSPSARTRTLKALIDAGYAARLLPSHDWPLVISGPVPQEFMDGYNPHGHLFIKNVVIKQLYEMGVDDSIISSMFVEGPRRFFEGG